MCIFLDSVIKFPGISIKSNVRTCNKESYMKMVKAVLLQMVIKGKYPKCPTAER